MIVPAVHDRACGHRGLLPAGRTFPARPAPLQFPAPVMAAGGADEAVGPAPGGEMPGTGGFIGKARLEGGAGHGAVIFPAAGHHGTLHEHAADAHQKLNISSNRAQRDKPYASFARMAETGCRSPANRLLLWYFPIARESDPGALVFVPQAAGFKLASLLDLVWRYHPPITWSSRILRASFKAIWASHLRENLDLGLVAGARNPRDRHLLMISI